MERGRRTPGGAPRRHVLKPAPDPRHALDVVWLGDAGARPLLTALAERHPGTRVLLVTPGPGSPGRRAGTPRLVRDRFWELVDDRRRRGFARAVIEAAWALDFSDPVLVSKLPNAELESVWRTLDGHPDDRADRLHASLAGVVRSGSPVHLTFVSSCARPSGAEVALARLAANLPDIEATAVLAEDGALVAMLADQGVAASVRPMSARSRTLSREAVVPGGALLRAAWDAAGYSLRLARSLRRDGTQLVATNNLKASLYGGVAGRLAGVPVVWHVRDRIADDYLPRPARALVRLAARVLPSGIIANSETTLATLGLPEAASRRLLAVAIGDPCPFADAVPSQTTSEPDPATPLTIGLVGRIAPWKGQDLFLRAVARAFPSHEVRARIVGAALFGEEDYEDQVRALADELGLGEVVAFTGHVDDVRAELERLDVVVHASVLPEPFGQVVVEAMALGRPVVAADAGGPAEFITDGVDGLLYPAGDAEALAERLRTLADDPQLRQRLAAAAPGGARRFAPADVGRTVATAYRQVLAVHPARRTRRSATSG